MPETNLTRIDDDLPLGRAAIDTLRPPLKIAVGIATVGRSDVLARTVTHLSRQTRAPDVIVVSASDQTDVAGLGEVAPEVRIVFGPRGLARQRNAVLAATAACDVLLFLDDDFLCDPDYLAAIERLFVTHDDVVCATGRVLADGIIGPGLSFEAGEVALGHASRPETDGLRDVYNAYGCNMAIRMGAQREHGLQFDENLPLYAWLEDVDFSRQLSPFGRIVWTPDACGVHLGVKGGRLSGLRLGYSQIANPIYLLRKGTCSSAKAITQMARNLAANCWRCLKPEPHVDRVGRLKGNASAILDLIRGRLTPLRVLDM